MIRIFQGKDFVTLKSVIAKAIKRAKDIQDSQRSTRNNDKCVSISPELRKNSKERLSLSRDGKNYSPM